MHDILDTETADAAAELFWPQDFKMFLRNEFRPVVIQWLKEQNILHRIHKRKSNVEYDLFLETLADKIIIGAENGADDAFEMVHKAFLKGLPLPRIFEWAENSLGREVFTMQVRSIIKQSMVKEYGHEHLYEHIFSDFYGGAYSSFEEFVRAVCQSALAGVINGAESMLMKILRSFIFDIALPPARRYPRSIKIL